MPKKLINVHIQYLDGSIDVCTCENFEQEDTYIRFLENNVVILIVPYSSIKKMLVVHG